MLACYLGIAIKLAEVCWHNASSFLQWFGMEGLAAHASPGWALPRSREEYCVLAKGVRG